MAIEGLSVDPEALPTRTPQAGMGQNTMYAVAQSALYDNTKVRARGDVAELLDDVLELRPTIFPSVPRLYNRIYDRVMGVFSVGFRA